MEKYCPENEKKKRDYSLFLEAVLGKQGATIDAALRAIERFEITTNFKPFSKFHVEQARSFRTRLREETGPDGKPLSAATIATTLKHLRDFFLWLSREQGFRKAINANDAHYFTPSEQDLRIASARREKRVATLEQIKHVLALMPAETPIEKRDQALLAFTILTGARDGALATFWLKHLDLKARTLFQDAREVRTKERKTFTSVFFPVGPEPLAIVEDLWASSPESWVLAPTIRSFHRPASAGARTKASWRKACRASPGERLRQFAKSSGRPSRRQASPTPSRTASGTRWRG